MAQSMASTLDVGLSVVLVCFSVDRGLPETEDPLPAGEIGAGQDAHLGRCVRSKALLHLPWAQGAQAGCLLFPPGGPTLHPLSLSAWADPSLQILFLKCT